MALPSKLRFSLPSLACGAAAFLCLLSPPAPARADEPGSDSVGVIEGEAILVTGPVRMETVLGRVRTTLRSGSEVSVKTGTARIDLVDGGQISICGPAHLSVLKSGGSLTVAVDTGTVHISFPHESGLDLYTPQVQARPLSIGGGPLEALIGFAPGGEMCFRAIRGAIRIEQQLTGQSIIIPQAGDIVLTNGQIDTLRSQASPCSCELQQVPPGPSATVEVSQIASAEEVTQTLPKRGGPPPEPEQEPTYQILIPPLVYDASAKVQPEIDPRTIILVRRVRIRSKLIFQGQVEGVPISADSPAPVSPVQAANQEKPPVQPAPSLLSRLRNYVKRLWSRNAGSFSR